MPALVLPVPAALAWHWASGVIGDSELIHATELLTAKGEALFYVSLFGGRSWREGLQQLRQMPGPMAIIFRTKHPTIARWAERYGFKKTFSDGDGEWRYWGGAETTAAFLRSRPGRHGSDAEKTIPSIRPPQQNAV